MKYIVCTTYTHTRTVNAGEWHWMLLNIDMYFIRLSQLHFYLARIANKWQFMYSQHFKWMDFFPDALILYANVYYVSSMFIDCKNNRKIKIQFSKRFEFELVIVTFFLASNSWLTYKMSPLLFFISYHTHLAVLLVCFSLISIADAVNQFNSEKRTSDAFNGCRTMIVSVLCYALAYVQHLIEFNNIH